MSISHTQARVGTRAPKIESRVGTRAPKTEARVVTRAPRSIEFPVEEQSAALDYFRLKLSLETDPADVHADMQNDDPVFVVVDARSPLAYARGHVPGAISLPHREIDAASTGFLARDRIIVTYCDGIGCNGSTKAALKLTALGFQVKEMLGGLDWWQRDGYAVVTAAEPTAPPPLARVKCDC
jgi:rhodanese-related sulfurtransferase